MRGLGRRPPGRARKARDGLPGTALLRIVAIGFLVPGHFWLPGTTGVAFAQNTAALAARVEVLEAREQIRELIHAYGEALDSRDFLAFAGLFAEDDGTWVGGFGSATGRDAIFELMDGNIGHADPPAVPTSHHVFANIRIDVDGDTAQARTRWIFVVPSETGEPRWRFLGHYEDRFVRRGGRWYFLRREAFTDLPPP
jgi:uncharacterized protein (TIGR02246 family)